MAALKPSRQPKRPSRRDSESTLILPAFRPLQLASLAKHLPKGDAWLYEMKFDGYRCLASIAGNQVRLFTRNGHHWTRQFGFVAPALSKLTRGTLLLDGEICAIDDHGRSNFTLLKNSLDGQTPLVFFAFDLLEQDGENLGDLPQLERKEGLEAILTGQSADSPVQYSQHIVGNGRDVLRAMCQGDFEGVIAKSPTARYGGERSTAWIKVKCVQRQEFVVVGWRPPRVRAG